MVKGNTGMEWPLTQKICTPSQLQIPWHAQHKVDECSAREHTLHSVSVGQARAYLLVAKAPVKSSWGDKNSVSRLHQCTIVSESVMHEWEHQAGRGGGGVALHNMYRLLHYAKVLRCFRTWTTLHNHRGRSPRWLCNITKVSKCIEPRQCAITDLDYGIIKNQPMKSLLLRLVHSCILATCIEGNRSDIGCQEEVKNVSSVP